jgi:hypothetical protein
VPEEDIEAVTELPYLENLPQDDSSDMKVWDAARVRPAAAAAAGRRAAGTAAAAAAGVTDRFENPCLDIPHVG